MVKKKESELQRFEEAIFKTPEQHVLKWLLDQPTTVILVRNLAGQLKHVRTLGGAEGLKKVLDYFSELDWIIWVDHGKAIRLNEEKSEIKLMKQIASVCNLETLKKSLQPFCTHGFLFGSRSTGKNHSDSDYDLFVVSEDKKAVESVVQHHPMSKKLEVVIWTPQQYTDIENLDPKLEKKLKAGIELWGDTWK